jgi:hypothetical protein
MVTMSQEEWTAVDRYITDLIVPADAVLDAALANSVAAGLPANSVSPNQGKADKVSTPEYFDWALELTRRGSLIVVDNVVRKGAVVEESSDDPSVQGVRRFY